MKKIYLLLVPVCLTLLMFNSCAPKTELTAYVGDGMMNPVLEIYDQFHEENPEIKIEFVFAGSGILAQTISDLQSGDIYIPGCLDFLDELDAKQYLQYKNPLVYHIPSIIVLKDNTAITTLEDLTKPGVRIGVAAPEQAAAGRMSEDTMENSGFRDALLANVAVYASDLRTTLELIINKDVDASISWAESTFYYPDDLKAVPIRNPNIEIPEVWGAVTVFSKHPEQAQRFVDYLDTDESLTIFEQWGFPKINEN